MKTMRSNVLLLIGFVLSVQLFAQSPDNDIINRLGFYSAKQCRLSVEQLKKLYPAKYIPPANWEATLDALEKNRNPIIARIKSEIPKR